MNSFDSFYAQALAKRISQMRDENAQAVLNGLPQEQYRERVGADRAYKAVIDAMQDVARELMSPDHNKGNRS